MLSSVSGHVWPYALTIRAGIDTLSTSYTVTGMVCVTPAVSRYVTALTERNGATERTSVPSLGNTSHVSNTVCGNSDMAQWFSTHTRAAVIRVSTKVSSVVSLPSLSQFLASALVMGSLVAAVVILYATSFGFIFCRCGFVSYRFGYPGSD